MVAAPASSLNESEPSPEDLPAADTPPAEAAAEPQGAAIVEGAADRSEVPTLAQPIIRFLQPDPDYRRAEGHSQSQIKPLLISPAHYRAALAEPRFPTTNMIMGTALHALLHEPETFDGLFMDRAECAKEPTVAELQELLTAQGVAVPSKAKKADLLALAFPDGLPEDQRTSLASDDFRAVHGMAKAIQVHPIAGPWYDPEQPEYRRFCEVSIYVRNEAGQILKARIDRLVFDPERQVISVLDLKSTDKADASNFARTIANFSYDLQGAWYTRLVELAYAPLVTSGWRTEFVFVAVERKAPHGVNVYRASDRLIEGGRRKMASALDLLAQCHALDYWPGYAPVVQSIDLPSWAQGEAFAPEVDL